MNVIQEINNVNDKFATQGSKLKIEKRGEKLNIRGSLPVSYTHLTLPTSSRV